MKCAHQTCRGQQGAKMVSNEEQSVGSRRSFTTLAARVPIDRIEAYDG